MHEPPTTPSGSLLRHDYIVANGNIYSFQAGDTGSILDMLWSQGWVDYENELPFNDYCETISDDENFADAIQQAVTEIGAPKYNVYAYRGTTPHWLGARNCQTWADDVIKRATEIHHQ